MGKSSELYQQVQESPDDSDYQYFQWLSNEEWQDYLEEEEKRLRKAYRDSPATFAVMYADFLIKNNLK